MQAEDDLVRLKGGDHLLLGVHHLELDVARDGVGQVEEGGDGRPVHVHVARTCAQLTRFNTKEVMMYSLLMPLSLSQAVLEDGP